MQLVRRDASGTQASSLCGGQAPCLRRPHHSVHGSAGWKPAGRTGWKPVFHFAALPKLHRSSLAATKWQRFQAGRRAEAEDGVIVALAAASLRPVSGGRAVRVERANGDWRADARFDRPHAIYCANIPGTLMGVRCVFSRGGKNSRKKAVAALHLRPIVAHSS